VKSVFDPTGLSEFARFYGFHYDVYEPEALVRNVLIDMDRGLRGQSSSLPMIPSYLSPVHRIQAGRKVLALDAGGTNLRVSPVYFDEKGQARVEGTVKSFMPGTRGLVTCEEFFDHIAALAGPLLEQHPDVEGLGFTFSYPMRITEDADGIPLAFSKELEAPEVIGRSVGAELRKALERRGQPFDGPIVLLNDTAATLLAGHTLISPDGEAVKTEDRFGSPGGPVIGLILGTGFNTAYPERSIPKIGYESPGEGQIVVCETGTFDLRYRGALDREFDAETKNPGAYTLEKAAAGAYLGPLCLHIFQQAIRDGILSFGRSSELLAMTSLPTRDLNEFQHNPLAGTGLLGSLFGREETGALASILYLASIVTERGALFSAAVVAAAVERVRQFGEAEPFAPIRIAVEGTTFLIYKGMRRALEAHLHRMLNLKRPCPYIIAPVEQASLLGAAVAAL